MASSEYPITFPLRQIPLNKYIEIIVRFSFALHKNFFESHYLSFLYYTFYYYITYYTIFKQISIYLNFNKKKQYLKIQNCIGDIIFIEIALVALCLTLKKKIIRMYMWIAGLAQLVEQLICNQKVGSSSLLSGTANKVAKKNFGQSCLTF